LNRGEAIQTLREIIRVCLDNGMAINYVDLTPIQLNNGLLSYQLKIGTRLNYVCRNSLLPYLKESNLKLEENEDHIIVLSH
jgi:hypothetical protein